jgi:hypothetical protein
MKKIILTCFLFLMTQSLVFADEIIDAKGKVILCKVVTVADDFVEYKKDGNLYSFSRPDESLVFNDYVDVRVKLYKRHSIERYFGKILVKDWENVRLRTENGDMDIPFYRVKFVGVFKP